MTWLRWILTVPLVAIGSGIALWNWRIIIASLANPRAKHESWIPLAGGVLASIGFLIPPDDDLRRLWWLPLVADWGCAPGMLATGIFHFWRLRRSHISGS